MAEGQKTGVAFYDVLRKDDGSFCEYVPANGFIGEYVNKLQQQAQLQAKSDGSGNDSSPLEQPGTPAPNARLPRWKRRTAQQVEANKLAQKRYRERKKAKLQQASAKVDNLTEQTQDYNSLEKEVNAKNAENVDLESQLMSLEAELQRLRVELDGKTPQGAFNSTSKISRIIGPSTLDAKTESIGEKWQKAKEKLDKLLESEGLRPGTSKQISPTVESKLQKRCAAAVLQCMQMLTFGGPALDDLLRTLPGNIDDLMREEESELYTRLVQSMELQPKQTEDILKLLPSVTERLERVYTERAELNSKVVLLLMARPAPAYSGVTAENDQAARLRSALDALQLNLTKEQILESEHHYAVMRKILTALQGAWFISRTYPRHCDTLAFMQAVRRLNSK